MPSIESPVAFRAAIVLAVAGALLASVPAQALDGPAVAPAAPEAAAPEAPVPAWGDRLWNAARTGESATVDRLLAEMPEGADPEASRRFRDAVSRRSDHMAATAKEVEQQRAEKLKEMNEAVAAGNATKALIGAAYLKFLGSDWKSTIGTPEVRAAVALAEKRVDEACAAGDWLLAEELLNRLRSLYEGTPDREAYDRFDARLETDIGRRVMLVLEYAPRAWYELRRRQWEGTLPALQREVLQRLEAGARGHQRAHPRGRAGAGRRAAPGEHRLEAPARGRARHGRAACHHAGAQGELPLAR
jgi:hypothetical protein